MIVFIFIVCHSVKWIPNLYELARLAREDKREWPPWVESVTHISHFLMVVNSSVNFYIYCIKHFNFWPAAGGGYRRGVNRSETMASMSLTHIDNNYTLSNSASATTSLGSSARRKSSAPLLSNKTRLSSVISL